MSITVNQISEEIVDYGFIGTRLQRTYEVVGVTNTAGNPEVYHINLDGQYNDGSIRFDVFVQRTNGSFATLNPNKHYQRISAVFSALREVTADFKAANQEAIRNAA
jgi:hypothetical protein